MAKNDLYMLVLNSKNGDSEAFVNLYYKKKKVLSSILDKYSFLPTSLIDELSKRAFLNFILEFNVEWIADFDKLLLTGFKKIFVYLIGDAIRKDTFLVTDFILSNNKGNVLINLCKLLAEVKYGDDIDVTIKIISENEVLRNELALLCGSNVTTSYIGKVSCNGVMRHFIRAYLLMNDKEEVVNDDFEDSDYDSDFESFSVMDLYNSDLDQVSGDLLSKEEELKLAEEAANGSLESRKILIEKNLKLVLKIAKRYANSSVSVEDLVQEGNLGLITALEKFDYKKGFRFSTYATYWIKQAVRKSAFVKRRTIKIPYYISELAVKMEKVKNDFFKKNGYYPSVDELASLMDLSKNRIYYIMDITQELTSLNASVQLTDDEEEMLEFVAETDSKSIEETVINNSIRSDIEMMFEAGGVSLRDRELIKYRFGLINGKRYSLEELALMYDISVARVSQIIYATFYKLRKKGILKNYLDYSLDSLKTEIFLDLIAQMKVKNIFLNITQDDLKSEIEEKYQKMVLK